MPSANLYVHFPFCRRKCTYCALFSRVATSAARDSYISLLARSPELQDPKLKFKTVYFGGGSPTLCDLSPILSLLSPHLADNCEFTVELHPLDVRENLLATLSDGGVNRISMGVESLDNRTLSDMGRGYDLDLAERAFARIRQKFDNAGIDLILGYPGDPMTDWSRLASWGLKHCSVYSLILEEKSLLGRRFNSPEARTALPDDDRVLDRVRAAAEFLASIGLDRYEISNYAVPGCECQHNLSVWRGEDYYGLGDGACGRVGLSRTRGTIDGEGNLRYETETVSPESDKKERTIFRLRTREGLDASHHPEWRPVLENCVTQGLLTTTVHQPRPPTFDLQPSTYHLTPRGTEVCDAILADLV